MQAVSGDYFFVTSSHLIRLIIPEKVISLIPTHSLRGECFHVVSDLLSRPRNHSHVKMLHSFSIDTKKEADKRVKVLEAELSTPTEEDEPEAAFVTSAGAFQLITGNLRNLHII